MGLGNASLHPIPFCQSTAARLYWQPQRLQPLVERPSGGINRRRIFEGCFRLGHQVPMPKLFSGLTTFRLITGMACQHEIREAIAAPTALGKQVVNLETLAWPLTVRAAPLPLVQ